MKTFLIFIAFLLSVPSCFAQYAKVYRNNQVVALYGECDVDSIVFCKNSEKVLSYRNEYIIDAGGNGDYTTLHDALIGTYGKDTKTKPITLRVMPGIYNEPEMINAFNPYCNKRNLSIIGTDKVNTIIRNSNGYYSVYEDRRDNSCLKVSGNIFIENLTFISTDENYKTPDSTAYPDCHCAYCIHIDSDIEDGDITEIRNCNFANDHYSCIGIGLKTGYTVKIEDCDMSSHLVTPSYSNAAIIVHGSRYDTSQKSKEHIIMKNNIIKCDNGCSVKLYSINGEKMDATFIGNACSFGEGMKGLYQIDTSQPNGIPNGSISITEESYGNNTSDMNKH